MAIFDSPPPPLRCGATFEAAFRPSASPAVLDAYTCAGTPPEARYTWDCQRNDNGDRASFFGGAQPRARYDRMFITQVLAVIV